MVFIHLLKKEGDFMFSVKGKFAEARIFTDLVEEQALSQIIEMLEQPITKNTRVAIMPDVHAGAGSTIGTTISLPENKQDWRVCPNVVGVDIGCGMMSYKLADKEIDLREIDEIVNKYIPSGFNIHHKPQNQKFTDNLIENLAFTVDNPERIGLSLGSLGGGNHFIEITTDEDGSFWLTVHSGSRNLGVQVAKHHQKEAERSMFDVGVDKIITELKAAGKEKDIERTIREARALSAGFNKELSFLTGNKLEQYLNDLALAQKFAHLNRKTMLDIIVEKAGLTIIDEFDSIHNFIDIEEGVIRKGATSARKGERLIIPLNMRDGSLICVGKGNEEWNYSAPHGAGRMLSRSAAKKELDLDEFKSQMAGVYTTSVGESTLDEAPNAYKPMEAIIDNIGDTVDIIHHLKPVWNFKAH